MDTLPLKTGDFDLEDFLVESLNIDLVRVFIINTKALIAIIGIALIINPYRMYTMLPKPQI